MDILKSIDVALAMVVIYLTFSLGVTALNESIAAVLSSRAHWLRKGVEALFAPAPAAANTKGAPQAAAAPAISLPDAFYRSPYISALGRTAGWQPRFAPSYIPSWTMVQGLLDAAAGASGTALATLDQVKTAVNQLPERSPIKTALNDLIAQADGNLAKLKELVEAWFQNFDQQVSAWYRQKTQHVLVGLSLLMVLGMNLDTVAMFRMLSTDTKLRTALVDRALEASKKPSADAVLNLNPLQVAQKELADAKAAKKPPAELQAAQKKLDDEQQAMEKAAKDLVAGIEATGLPLGWGAVDVAKLGPLDWVLKAAGLALSAFALAMGAPFWFDLLQKLASIRAVGKNPAELLKQKAA